MGFLNWRLMILILLLQICPLYGRNWFGFLFPSLETHERRNWFDFLFPSSENHEKKPSKENLRFSRNRVADFSLEIFTNEKARKKLANARNLAAVASPNSCWQKAYQDVLSGCAETIADEKSMSIFTWVLVDCFLQDSGRGNLPACDSKSPFPECHKYLEYYLETNKICYQLQIYAFKEQTEKLVNELRRAAEFAGIKLQSIGEHDEKLLQNSEKINDSLTSLVKHSQNLAEISNDVETHLSGCLFNHTKIIDEQVIEGIASSLVKLMMDGQDKMIGNVVEGMAAFRESYNDLDKGMHGLKNETVTIGKEINEIVEELSLKMNNLDGKANDIDSKAESILDKQQVVLDGQSEALHGLQILTKFQSEALEKSKENVEQMAEFIHKQEEENLRIEEQLQRTGDCILEKAKTIVAAQETLEAKQSNTFATLDKILSLVNNSIQMESRLLKAAFVYLFLIILVQIFTSTEKTFDARRKIHLYWVISFFNDLLFWWMTDDLDTYQWLVTLNRSIFGIASIYQIIYYYSSTYCDYLNENHQRLMHLEEAENEWRRHEKYKDSEVNWSSWLQTDLPDDLGKLEDPDYSYSEED